MSIYEGTCSRLQINVGTFTWNDVIEIRLPTQFKPTKMWELNNTHNIKRLKKNIYVDPLDGKVKNSLSLSKQTKWWMYTVLLSKKYLSAGLTVAENFQIMKKSRTLYTIFRCWRKFSATARMRRVVHLVT